MANLSNATGTITMKRAFYEKHKNLINESLYSGGDYGFYYIAENPSFVSDDEVEIDFEGTGRYKFSSTLDSPYCWNQSKEFEEILKKEKPTFHLYYTDYEWGCQIFQKEDVTVTFSRTGDDLAVFSVVTDTEYIDPTDYNRVNLGFEDGYKVEDIQKGSDEYLNSLLKEIKSEKDYFSVFSQEQFNQIFAIFVTRNDDLQGAICQYKLESFFDYDEENEFLNFLKDGIQRLLKNSEFFKAL